MEKIDIKSALRNTLTQKQELVRDYQTVADKVDDSEVSKMYKHFAEAEMLHATQIKDKLNKWNQ
jgi:rubrerythrin